MKDEEKKEGEINIEISESIKRVIEDNFKISKKRGEYLRKWKEEQERVKGVEREFKEVENKRVREYYSNVKDEGKDREVKDRIKKDTAEISSSIENGGDGIKREVKKGGKIGLGGGEEERGPKGWGGSEYPRCYNEHEEIRKREQELSLKNRERDNLTGAGNDVVTLPIYQGNTYKRMNISKDRNLGTPPHYRWNGRGINGK